jgi:molybdopterin synthase sulfur carrier subunit
VGAVFDELIGRFPSLANNLVDGEGHLHKFVNVYVDDEDIRYVDGLATPVKDGQTIAILPAVAGG